jgi:hypothetical protein
LDSLDLSNYSSRFGSAEIQEWKAYGIGLVIIQLIAGVRRNGDSCQDQIDICLENGLAVDCYLFPGNDGLGMSTNQRLALVPSDARNSIRQLWVDVEPATTNPNRHAIDAAIVDCDIWAPWQKTGTYSARWVADKMGWLPWPWPRQKQWLVNVLNSGAPNLGGEFSGTLNHVMTQYRMDVTLAGVSGMDMSLLTPSESEAVTQWLGGNMEPIPQDYKDKFGEDVTWQGVVDNLEGIIHSLQDQLGDPDAAVLKAKLDQIRGILDS